MRIWSYPVEAKIFNPQDKAFNLKTTNIFFIGYSERSKEYRFYYLSHKPQIVETSNARILKAGMFSGSEKP